MSLCTTEGAMKGLRIGVLIFVVVSTVSLRLSNASTDEEQNNSDNVDEQKESSVWLNPSDVQDVSSSTVYLQLPLDGRASSPYARTIVSPFHPSHSQVDMIHAQETSAVLYPSSVPTDVGKVSEVDPSKHYSTSGSGETYSEILFRTTSSEMPSLDPDFSSEAMDSSYNSLSVSNVDDTDPYPTKILSDSYESNMNVAPITESFEPPDYSMTTSTPPLHVKPTTMAGNSISSSIVTENDAIELLLSSMPITSHSSSQSSSATTVVDLLHPESVSFSPLETFQRRGHSSAYSKDNLMSMLQYSPSPKVLTAFQQSLTSTDAQPISLYSAMESEALIPTIYSGGSSAAGSTNRFLATQSFSSNEVSTMPQLAPTSSFAPLFSSHPSMHSELLQSSTSDSSQVFSRTDLLSSAILPINRDHNATTEVFTSRSFISPSSWSSNAEDQVDSVASLSFVESDVSRATGSMNSDIYQTSKFSLSSLAAPNNSVAVDSTASLNGYLPIDSTIPIPSFKSMSVFPTIDPLQSTAANLTLVSEMATANESQLLPTSTSDIIRTPELSSALSNSMDHIVRTHSSSIKGVFSSIVGYSTTAKINMSVSSVRDLMPSLWQPSISMANKTSVGEAVESRTAVAPTSNHSLHHSLWIGLSSSLLLPITQNTSVLTSSFLQNSTVKTSAMLPIHPSARILSEIMKTSLHQTYESVPTTRLLHTPTFSMSTNYSSSLHTTLLSMTIQSSVSNIATITILTPSASPPPLVVSLLDKSSSLLEFSISLSSYGIDKLDRLDVIVQQYRAIAADSDNNLLPLTWYKVNRYSEFAYRSYITQRIYFTSDENRRHRMRRDIVHIPAPSDDLLYIRVGDESGCNSPLKEDLYCNGPLLPGKKYRFRLHIYSNGANEPVRTAFSLPLSTQDSSDNGGKDDGSPTAALTQSTIIIIIVIVLIIILVFVLFVVGLFLWRRRSRGTALGVIEADGRCALLQKCKQSKTIKRPQTSGYYLDEQQVLRPISKGLTRPVSVKDFLHWVTRSSADSDFRFAEEFESIREVGRDETHDASDMAENRGKNRYVNVLAYDHTRVKLSYTDDEAGSDYINANYIHGYKQPRAYIATQGPLPGTTDDFWRMVWEQDCQVIVMVTQCVERGRVKCHRYWPTVDPTLYGDICVSLLSEFTYPDWIEREFLLENEGDPPRRIHHLQYSSWPDHGVPKSQSSILEFVKAVRTLVLPSHGPMIVHCSAGVGRTGTFIAVDMIMMRLVEENTVDIYGTICLMRMQRSAMVQTEDQYIFIHRAILQHLQLRQREASSLKGYSLLPADGILDQASVREELEEKASDLFGDESTEKSTFLDPFIIDGIVHETIA